MPKRRVRSQRPGTSTGPRSLPGSHAGTRRRWRRAPAAGRPGITPATERCRAKIATQRRKAATWGGGNHFDRLISGGASGVAQRARFGARSARADRRAAGNPSNIAGAMGWICARIRYRRGQRAMCKWRSNGSLTSRSTYQRMSHYSCLSNQKSSSGKQPRREGKERFIERPWITDSVLPVVAARREEVCRATR